MIVLLSLMACDADLRSFLPTVRFDRLDVKAVSFEDIDVDFVFAVDNPNPVGFPVDRFGYALELAGVELLAGDTVDGLQLAAEGSSDVALPVHFAFASLYEAVQASRGEDTLPFALRGNFGWDTDLGPVDVAMDEDGEFPALRKPAVRLSDLRMGGVTGSEVGATLDLDVDNDHGSPLGLANLDFDVRLGGTRVGGGALADAGVIDGASHRTVSLPMALDLVGAASAIAAAATGGSVDLGLGASLDVDTPFGVVPLTLDEQGNVRVGE
jgi:LEA14-like dessication related protein